MPKRTLAFSGLFALGGALSGCTPVETAEARSVSPSAAVTQSRASATASTATTKSSAALRFVTAPSGNSARYRIREQLVGLDLPNDAIGETKSLTGVIAVDAQGKLIPAESKFTVDVTGLTSDKDRRDGFVKRRVLQTDQYPTVTLVPTSVRGISLPLPTSGSRTFEILGDLTVRGVTRPTLWKATAQFKPDGLTGAAATAFTFTDFSIDQPRVPVVLSVADTIKLELDFTLIKQKP